MNTTKYEILPGTDWVLQGNMVGIIGPRNRSLFRLVSDNDCTCQHGAVCWVAEEWMDQYDTSQPYPIE